MDSLLDCIAILIFAYFILAVALLASAATGVALINFFEGLFLRRKWHKETRGRTPEAGQVWANGRKYREDTIRIRSARDSPVVRFDTGKGGSVTHWVEMPSEWQQRVKKHRLFLAHSCIDIEITEDEIANRTLIEMTEEAKREIETIMESREES